MPEQMPSPPERSLPDAASRAVGRAYDARADEYVAHFGDVGAAADDDVRLIRRWRDGTTGALLDAGCGPGHWTHDLASGSPARDVIGVDASEGFITHARASHPAERFVLGALDALPVPDGSLGGVLAWYSLIHTEPGRMRRPLEEFARCVVPGGCLLLGLFDGPAREPFPHAVTTAYFWSEEAMTAELADAGFTVVETHRRTDEGHRPHLALVATRNA